MTMPATVSDQWGKKLVWLLITVLFATVAALAGGWASEMNRKDEALAIQQRDQYRELDGRVRAMEQQYGQILVKLDILIEQHKVQNPRTGR